MPSRTSAWRRLIRASASAPTVRTRAPRAAWRRRVASSASGSTGRATGSTRPRGSARPVAGVARQPQTRALEPASRSVASAASAPRAARLTTTHVGDVAPRDSSAASPAGTTVTCRPSPAAAAHAGSSSTTTTCTGPSGCRGAAVAASGAASGASPAARRLGIRVRRRPRLLRRARRGQGALEVGLGRRGGALGRGPQLLLRPLLACRGLAQLGRQQVPLALPLAHLRGPACRHGLGLREARPELLELRRALGRIGLPLLAQRGDPALQLGDLCARLHVAEAGLLQPLLEAPALGEQRARALLQLCDLVARALLLVLERLDCALGAGERGAGALGLRVRRSACLLGGPGSGQRPLEVVLVCRRRALAGGVQPLLGVLHALARLAQRGSQLLPLALGRLHPLALAGGRGLGLRAARHP